MTIARFSFLAVLLATSAGCASVPRSGTAGTESAAPELEQLNRQLTESAILRRDTTFWAGVALDELIVIPPGGILEDRAQVFAGMRVFDVRALTLVTERVVIHDNTAVVVGKLTLDGGVGPSGRLGPMRFLSVFVRTADGWKLLARSVTPCVERAIQAGRC